MQSLFGEESALLNGYALSAGKQKTRKSRKTSGYEILVAREGFEPPTLRV